VAGSNGSTTRNRKGAAYRDNATAQKFNRGASADAVKSRETFRGRAEQGRQDIARAAPTSSRKPGCRGRDFSGQKGGAFSGTDRGGSATRDFSSRGSSSRQSMSSSGGGSEAVPVVVAAEDSVVAAAVAAAAEGGRHAKI